MTLYNRSSQLQQDPLPQSSSQIPSTFDFGSNLGNSPLNGNSMLNNTNTSVPQYNNLSLSSRSNGSNGAASSSVSNGFFSGGRANAGAGLPTSVSPSLNFNSLYSSRARFNASKGFDLEDDLEFCPEIQDQFLHPRQPASSSSSKTSGSSNFTHHRFNPYTTTTYSPQVSPTLSNNNSNNNTSSVSTPPVSKNSPNARLNGSPSGGNSSPRTITPRAKKVLEIVNPVTGLRVSSPAPFK